MKQKKRWWFIFDLRYTSEPDQFMLLLNLGSSLRKVGRGQFLLRWKNIYSHNVSFEHARDSQWTSMWEMAMWCSFAIWDVQSAQIMSPPKKKQTLTKPTKPTQILSSNFEDIVNWIPVFQFPIAGWWFGTFFIFPYIGLLIIPID